MPVVSLDVLDFDLNLFSCLGTGLETNKTLIFLINEYEHVSMHSVFALVLKICDNSGFNNKGKQSVDQELCAQML